MLLSKGIMIGALDGEFLWRSRNSSGAACGIMLWSIVSSCGSENFSFSSHHAFTAISETEMKNWMMGIVDTGASSLRDVNRRTAKQTGAKKQKARGGSEKVLETILGSLDPLSMLT